MKTILQKNEPALRTHAGSVPKEMIPGKELETIIADMKAALARASDGVALAAPQIGVSLRMFIVSGKVFSARDDEATPVNKDSSGVPDEVFINPVIVKKSREKKWLPEGCLSVRHWYGETHRHARITITALDERGKKITRGSSGLLAQIFQHEIDHLDGILFSDHARKLEEVLPEKSKESEKK